jgi:TPR repeat protein
VRWYRLAADQGYADAQGLLGTMYSNGEGVLEGDKEAVRWYRLAADQGYARAQFSLGIMYDNGKGVLADPISSHMWFNIAGANGHDDAGEQREIVEKKMTRADKSEAVKSARTCMSSDYRNCR